MQTTLLAIGLAISTMTSVKYGSGTDIARWAASYLRCSTNAESCSSVDKSNVRGFDDWIDVIYTLAQDGDGDTDYFCGDADRLSSDGLARGMAAFVRNNPKLWKQSTTDMGLLALSHAYGCAGLSDDNEE